ncbi:HupE/UreJ family protein [Pararhizobium sp. IMCC21322]|uniref:HupE/UreJ family protein n=1 Tax=Pararhizobium sp. IMCC21322 TaxID=3067903 RepID=UPI0027417809|nr:HupE/UreJ family protein [Pararhizobium sp. IMCC21322]
MVSRSAQRNSTGQALWLTWLACALILVSSQAFGHGVARGDQTYLMNIEGVHPFPFLYLGAKHMVTGYDHLLYLAGVIFFLRELKDVVKFVSLFAVGHSITLLFGVLSGIQINAYLVDAIIGLSVCYKALENLGTIRFLDPRIAVFGFGLVHGFGLSTKLQDLSLSQDGLVANMIYFNIGVEIGQIIALTFLLVLFSWLRSLHNFPLVARNANIVLFGAGLLLFGLQIVGFIII